jgi:predicted transcriptional regulator
MNVSLDPTVQAKLHRLAAERGSDAESLAREAIERFVNYLEQNLLCRRLGMVGQSDAAQLKQVWANEIRLRF